MSRDDLPPGAPVLRGTTAHHGPFAQDWFIWHPVQRRYRRVAAVEFTDGEILHLADDTPRTERRLAVTIGREPA